MHRKQSLNFKIKQFKVCKKKKKKEIYKEAIILVDGSVNYFLTESMRNTNF